MAGGERDQFRADRAWAPDLWRTAVSCGHFMAEEAPDVVTGALRDLLAR